MCLLFFTSLHHHLCGYLVFASEHCMVCPLIPCTVTIRLPASGHIRGKPLYYLYFVYFFNSECATLPEDLDFKKLIEDIFPLPNSSYQVPTQYPIPEWPEKFETVESTHNLVLGYAVLSVLWAVTSVIIIVAGIAHVRTWIAYVPWILVAAANIVLDVVATITFALQVTSAQTFWGLLELIGIHNIPQEVKDLDLSILTTADGLTMIPSLVMTLVSCRLGLFWLLNVLLLICVSTATHRLSRDKDKKSNLPPYQYKRDNTDAENNSPHYQRDNKKTVEDSHVPRNYNPGYVKDNPTNRTENQPYSHQYKRDNATVENKNGHPVSRNYNPGYVNDNPISRPENRPYANRLNPQPEYDYETGYINNKKPFSYTPDDPKLTSFQNPSHSLLASSTAIPRAGPISHTSEPDYLECLDPNPWSYNPSAPVNEEPRPLPEVPRKQPTDQMNYENMAGAGVKRRAPGIPYRPEPSGIDPYRRPESYDDVKPVNRNPSLTGQDRPQEPHRSSGARLSNSMPPDELRSQLPWSYFGPRNAQMKPKSKQTHVEEEEWEKPPVPVPDYTLHFGKLKRPSNSNWSEDGSSSASSIGNHRGSSATGNSSLGQGVATE